MSQQNLLGIGFDVNTLSAEAQQVLTIVQNLYTELKKYDGMKISPIASSGVTELVSAAKAQQTSVEALNKTISDLSLSLKTYNQVAKETASVNAKIAISDTELGKANAAAKVQLDERKRALKEEAQNNNQSFQQRKKQREDEERNKKFTEDNEKARLERQKAYQKEQDRLQAEYAKEQKKRQAENERDKKKSDSEEAKRKAQEAKDAVKQSNLYQQLQDKRKDLESKYANAVISKAPKDVQKGLAAELREANQAIEGVDKAMEKAGSSGASTLGRGLNSVMGSVRQIAYIVPGLGIAGIFNLIFEGIGACIDALGLFDKEMDKVIENEKRFADISEQAADSLETMADALGHANELLVERTKALKDLAAASGQNFEEQIGETDAVLAAQKKAADETVKNLHATDKTAEDLNKRAIELQREKDAAIGNSFIFAEELRKLDQTKANWHNFVDVAIYRAARGAKLKSEQETYNKYIELLDQELNTTKQKYKEQSDALKEQRGVNDAIQQTQAERTKYFSDEERKVRLSNALATAEKLKSINEEILSDDMRTRDEKIMALTNISKANEDVANAKLQDVLSKIGVTGAEITDAQNTYNQALVDNELSVSTKLTKIMLDFYLKQQEMLHKTKQTELLMEQITDKTVMDNEQEVYAKRLDALMEYTNDREEIVFRQYQKDVEFAKLTTPADLLPTKLAELRAEYNKQIVDIENGIRKDAFEITQSWFNKQNTLAKEQGDFEQNEAQKKATNELIELNQSFNNKEISYRKFAKTRQFIEYDSQVNIKNAKIADDKSEIARLEALQKEIQAHYAESSLLFSNATTQPQRDSALGEMQASNEQLLKVGKQIGDKRTELSKDQLNKEEYINKVREDAIKQKNANWMQLEKEAVQGIQSIVDQSFDHRIQKLQELADAYDAAADAEIEAIERSSLTAKDKNAYEIQLQAQKESRDRGAAQEAKKLRHEQAVFDKEVSMAQIVFNTTMAVTGALAQAKILGPLAGALAISYAALGATQLAIAAAQQIPSYAFGGIHEEAGLALFGEAGRERVVEPGGRTYVAEKPTIKHLPAGTELIPLYDIPSFSETGKPDTWAQTLYLGKQIAKSKKEIKNIIKPKINIDLGSEYYKQRILHG
jgi:hypothetical protein